jgi:hypothetical protein
MSNPREKYGVNREAERAGAVVQFDEWEFIVRSSLEINREYEYAKAVAADKRRAELNAGGVRAHAVIPDILIEAFAECVIVGWRNVTNGHGEPLEFNRQNCIELMQDCPQIWARIKEAALDESRFRLVTAREDGEQLGKS